MRAAMVVLALVVVAPSFAGDGLVWRRSHEAAFRVRVPAHRRRDPGELHAFVALR